MVVGLTGFAVIRSILNLEFKVFSLSFSQIILLAIEIYQVITRVIL